MTPMQVWLLIGIPALLIGLVLYTMRSPRLGAMGLFVLIAAAAGVAMVDRVSAAVLGACAVLLYAAGLAGHGGAVGEDPVRPAGSSHLGRPPSADARHANHQRPRSAS